MYSAYYHIIQEIPPMWYFLAGILDASRSTQAALLQYSAGLWSIANIATYAYHRIVARRVAQKTLLRM
jgi:hypothetical protein